MRKLTLAILVSLLPVVALGQGTIDDLPAASSLGASDMLACAQGTTITNKCSLDQVKDWLITYFDTEAEMEGVLTDVANLIISTEIDTEAELEALLSDVSNMLVSTELDTEAELEALLGDVTDVLTNNDTITADAANADTIDAITEIAAALRLGSDLKLATGNAGSTDECAKWNVDGDLVSAGAPCGTGGGDSLSIDSGAVVDPDFVSTGDVDFVDTSNTITANLNIDVIDATHMANADHGDISWSNGFASLDDSTVDSPQINDDSILEVDLNADNVAVADDILTFSVTADNFAWQTPTELSIGLTRQAATDCTAETGGATDEQCHEADDNKLYICESGPCNGSGWIAYAGTGATTETGLESDLGDTTNVLTDNDASITFDGAIDLITSANGDIDFSPNGTGEVNVNSALNTQATAAPTIAFKDSDSIADPADDNATISGNLTDTGDGTEDMDVLFQQQVAGTPTDFLAANADGVGNARIVFPDSSIGPDELLAAGQTDEYALTYEATGDTWEWTAMSAGTPGGSTTQVQFNDASAFGGDAGLTYNKTTDALTVGTGAGTITGSAGGVDLVLGASDVATIGDGGTTDYVQIDENGVTTFAGAASLAVPNGATPTTDATAEIALDTTITDHQPLIQYYDGAENMTVIAIDTAQLPATDNEIVKYDAGTDKFVLEADAGAAGGDSIEIDSVAVVDPDFVSTGDIDFTDTSNTVTADINAGVILEADLNADEAPVDNDILTFDTTGSNFSWQTPAELSLATTSHASTHSDAGADEVTAENLATACTDVQVLGGDGSGGVECQADVGGSSSWDVTDTDANPILTVDDTEQVQFIGAGTVTIVAAADASNHDVTITGSAHVTDTGPSPDCSGTSTYQDGEGGCDAVGGDVSGALDAISIDADTVGTGELSDGSDTPAVSELVRVDSASSTALEYGPCTMTDAGVISCPAPATAGGTLTLLEGQDDGTDTWILGVPDSGLSGDSTCTVEADGDIPSTCLGVVAHEEGGLEADVSAYNGLIRIASGSTSNVTNLSGLNTAIGSSIADGPHTATAITDGLIVEADLNEDSGTPTDEDVLTYDSTGANFNWVAQSTVAAGTAAALAADPGDCGANEFADAIAASGNLTCNAIVDADVPDTITIDLATTATTATLGDSATAFFSGGEIENTYLPDVDALTLAGSTDHYVLQATGATTYEFDWPIVRYHATDCAGLTDGEQGDVCWEADANTMYVCETATCNAAGWTAATAAGDGVGYDTVEDNDTPETQRAILNLISGGTVTVSCADDVDTTDCTFTGSAHDGTGTDDQNASEVPFTPDDGGEWTGSPAEVDAALEDLAPRVTANDAKTTFPGFDTVANDYSEDVTDDDLSDDLIIALSGVTTVTDGSFCQGGATNTMDCDVAPSGGTDITADLEEEAQVGTTNFGDNAADDEIPLGSAANTASWVAMANCVGENHLQYTAATNTFSCDDDDTGAVSEDSVGTTELDDGADTPATGEYLRVDTVDQAGIEYRSTVEVLGDIGAAASGANSDITSITGLTTDLTVAQGGTGAGTFTDGGILLGSGTGAITALGEAANGQIPIGDGSTDPVLNEIDGTANEIEITDGAGTIQVGIVTAPTLDAGNITGIPAGAYDADSIDSDDVAAELMTKSHCITIADPATDDEWYSVWRAPTAVTITEIYCEVTGGTNIAFDFEIDDGAITGVNGSNITCTTSGVTDSTLGGDTAMADGDKMDIDFGTASGTNTQGSFCFEYTIN